MKNGKRDDIIGGEMKIIFNNKKAFHNFFVSDLVEAGIELQGFEVKSIRDGAVNLSDSYVKIKNGEAWLKNCYIAPYDKNGLTSSYDSRRTRKLLLHKGEILRLERMANEKGLSIVPTKIYIDKGRVKIEIGLAKGKKLYDKRAVLRDRAIARDIDQTLKNL